MKIDCKTIAETMKEEIKKKCAVRHRASWR